MLGAAALAAIPLAASPLPGTGSPTVTPSAATIDQLATQQLTASGFTGGSVTWSRVSQTALNTASIDSAGLVTAGAPGSATTESAIFRATGVSNPSQTADSTISVNPVVVDVTPSSVTIPISTTYQLTGVITGSTNTTGTWLVVSGAGSVNSSGLYTAPGSTTTATIRLTSNADSARFDESTITVANVVPTVLPVAAYGSAYTGLATVAAKIFNADGTTYQDWSTTGIQEAIAGSGSYLLTLNLTATFSGFVLYRTASTNGVYAAASINPPATASTSFARPLPPADYGAAYSGLATVAYRLLNADYSVNTDWTTTGVAEMNNGIGIYRVAPTLARSFSGYVIYRQSSSNPVYLTAEVLAIADAASTGGALSRILTGM